MTIKRNMTRVRYYFLLAIFIVAFFLIWSQFLYLNSQKNRLRILASEIQKFETEMNVEIKAKIETALDLDLSLMGNKTKVILSEQLLFEEKSISTAAAAKTDPLKYILIWTMPNHDPLMYLGKGQETFIKKKCKVKNCFITTNKRLFQDITEFEVILFNGPEVVDKKSPRLPPRRSPDQNYVFASIESSDYYPICDNKLDGYFNVSWTYKLNSDIFYGYIIIRNKEGEVIGPKKEMHWMSIDEMNPIDNKIKDKLSSKKKLAAWLVSNCNAPSGRDGFVKRVQNKLKLMGNDMTVDVFGDCGTTPCRRADMPKCLEMIEKEYYFYFSFENSFTEDYVTEKVLHPLQHYTVPVVFGTANYTRFLPDGIYLNAKELGEDALAEKMVEIASDKEKYYKHFRWIGHYTFHYVEESPETDFHCKFCEAMNDDKLMKTTKVIQNFKEWWNPPMIRRGVPCPPRLIS